MPNGRSGGFLMNAADWKELATVVPEETVVGDILDGDSIRAISVADVIRLVEASPSGRVAVEEQHHDSYIVHIRNEPEILWIGVGPASPLLPELRRLHARFMAEHPGWNGWIAF